MGKNMEINWWQQYKGKICLVFLIMLVFILLVFFLLVPRVTLKGKSTIIVNRNGEYKEPGYQASYLFDSLTDKVKVSGNVNSKKDGIYYITYNSQREELSR